MHNKLTITVEPEVYAGLHSVIGRGNISKFLNNLARPHVLHGALEKEMEKSYRAVAADEAAEADALEWIEANIDDGLDDE